jgi:hypothetical protein
MAIFDLALFDILVFDIGPAAAIPPYDWAPALDLDTSTVIAQAMRFMQLAPITRYGVDAEQRPALSDAFDQAMDDCLAASDWTFASVLAVLSPQFAAPLDAAVLPLAYSLPGDCMNIREVHPQNATWRIDGRTLLTDQAAPLVIRYTARVTREDWLPATFRTAVALMIASRLGTRFSNGAIDPVELTELAASTLKQAMREDGIQSASARILPTSDLGYGAGSEDWSLEAVA